MNDFSSVVSRESSDLHITRSRFKMPQTIKTTANEGDLIPFFFKEVLPGDTFSVDTSFLARMATPIFPVMDNAFIDIAFFYVPNRLVWDHWSEFLGENKSAPWTQETLYTIPQIKFDYYWSTYLYDSTKLTRGYGPLKSSVMNYLGVPTSIVPCPFKIAPGQQVDQYPSITVSDLPNRAYRLIWNEFYRDENLQNPVPVYTDDSDRSYKDIRCENVMPGYDYGGAPLKVCKFHDLYTSCLPEPQKGPLVSIAPLSKLFPVYANVNNHSVSSANPLHWAYRTNSGGTPSVWSSSSTGSNHLLYKDVSNGTRFSTGETVTSSSYEVTPDNLVADLSSLGISVSAIREAFAVQRLYEAYARHGTRYREILRGVFGVTVPDMRVQVPEYLGGDRIPINMDQVLQTSSTDSVSPQGNTAGYSLTSNVQHSFTHSFVEHGMILGLACIRVEHTYSQGCEPFWFRKRLFDFYFPQFANLSEQPIFRRNLCATGVPSLDNQVFGYQEAWADYRMSINRLSGWFSPDCWLDTDTSEMVLRNSSISDAWTYSDFYHYTNYDTDTHYLDFDTFPTLSDEWIREDSSNVQQTLAVSGEQQFVIDFRLNILATRPLPVWSVPGLIDHH